MQNRKLSPSGSHPVLVKRMLQYGMIPTEGKIQFSFLYSKGFYKEEIEGQESGKFYLLLRAQKNPLLQWNQKRYYYIFLM